MILKTKALLLVCLGICALVVLTSCSGWGQNLPVSSPAPGGFDSPTAAPATIPVEPLPTAVISSETLPSTSTSVPDPTRQTTNPRIQYQIDAQLDYASRRVEVTQKVLIPHPADHPLDELVLIIPPRAWPQAFTFDEFAWGDGEPVDEYDLQGVKLTIPLDEYWVPGETRQLSMSYTLELPVQNAREGYGPSPFGYTQLQTNLVDWYPLVPPYREDAGWVAHEPWIFGEYLVYPAADYEVGLQIINSPELVVAASGKELTGTSTRRYHLEDARNFVFSISPDYQVLAEEVGGTTVLGYIFPSYQDSGKAAFQTTVEALELYRELYGPYHQETLSMVQADFNHGMEYEGLYFQSRGFFDTYNGTEKNFLTIIAAHETAHQWWYGQVANDQALEPWLDEALCTFSELVYYENYYPEAVEWWWAVRVNYYQPEGAIDRSIYDFTGPGDNYLNYRDATYLQGVKFIVRLRETLGETRFYAFLQDYLVSYENQVASGEDFFRLLDGYLEEDPGWLGEYFSREGEP
ncbi:MAG: M1 family metallopeptidase [Anaerolineales bacterium]|nr:M1 family metallopeptidase [Anaerolineales bacterium]